MSGLWFTPSVTAVSSTCLQAHMQHSLDVYCIMWCTLFSVNSLAQLYIYIYAEFLKVPAFFLFISPLFFCCIFASIGEQGWHSGEGAHLPPMLPRFNSRSRCHMWVEFVVGSRPCSERFFSWYSSFPLSSKTNFPNSNSIQNPRAQVCESQTVRCHPL